MFDGRLPNRVTPSMVEDGRAQFDALAGEAGRDPACTSISVSGEEAELDLVRSFHDAGADGVVVRPAPTDTEEAMARELSAPNLPGSPSRWKYERMIWKLSQIRHPLYTHPGYDAGGTSHPSTEGPDLPTSRDLTAIPSGPP